MYVHFILIIIIIAGFIYGYYEWLKLANIDITKMDDTLSTLLKESNPDIQGSLSKMTIISEMIAKGSITFLKAEYFYILIFVIIAAIVLTFSLGIGTSFSFCVGAFTSLLAGYIGMSVATYANIRTARQAVHGYNKAFDAAFGAGKIVGVLLVTIGVLSITSLMIIYNFNNLFKNKQELYESLAGFGFGASSIALFARVGGGIFTKSADVGADLSGKNSYGLAEDDYRNPACIADNVGDNVGDVAGMSADLFGSFAESTCAALVVSGSAIGVTNIPGLSVSIDYMMFPVLLTGFSIIVSLITFYILDMKYFVINKEEDIEVKLKTSLVISTLIQTPLTVVLAYYILPNTFYISGFGLSTNLNAAISILTGLYAGIIIGLFTDYCTSYKYTPVIDVAKSQMVSAATGIIYGLSLGYKSCYVPVACIAISVCISHVIAGMYGVALAALGMLSILPVCLAIDIFGPVADNAGGLAEMSGLPRCVREKTDALDSAGNTTAAVGKGFAIGSAAMVSLALFGAYTVRARITSVNLLDPWTFTGLLCGALMPFIFAGMTMQSVGVAANCVVKECMLQFPQIIKNHKKPDYDRVIKIATEAALYEMLAPGSLVLLSPIVAGMLFGKNCAAGVLAGALVCGVQIAISSANSGGAWDNAKKYVEKGSLGLDNCKGSSTHINAVTGDTVGDPMKDTSGPSINILVKLSAITTLLFGSILDQKFSNAKGGPIWL